jgi:hypothetical protein
MVVLCVALALSCAPGFRAPAIEPAVPSKELDQAIRDWLESLKPSTIEDTFPPSWRAVHMDSKPYWRAIPEQAYGDPFGLLTGALTPNGNTPQLTVKPLLGIAPLATTITLRLASPHSTDRELELTVWDAGDEDMAAPLFRSTRDVLWPDDKSPQPQTLRAHWLLPAGSLLVVGCVLPRAACQGQRVGVS